MHDIYYTILSNDDIPGIRLVKNSPRAFIVKVKRDLGDQKRQHQNNIGICTSDGPKQRKSRGLKSVTRLIDLKPEKVESSLLLGFGLAGGVSVQFDIYLLFKSLVIVLQDFHYLWT